MPRALFRIAEDEDYRVAPEEQLRDESVLVNGLGFLLPLPRFRNLQVIKRQGKQT